jgi:hypothetical protein
LTEAVEAFNGRVWKAKQDAGQSLAAPIDDMDIPEILVGMADEFTSMHKLGMAAEPEAE